VDEYETRPILEDRDPAPPSSAELFERRIRSIQAEIARKSLWRLRAMGLPASEALRVLSDDLP
jgi:hypothetical protein